MKYYGFEQQVGVLTRKSAVSCLFPEYSCVLILTLTRAIQLIKLDHYRNLSRLNRSEPLNFLNSLTGFCQLDKTSMGRGNAISTYFFVKKEEEMLVG